MRAAAAIIATILISATPAIARDVRPAEIREQSFSGSVPACDDGAVLGHISSYFALREFKYWNSPLRIVHFEGVQSVATRPWGLDHIPRRFCSATVLVSDGVKRRVDFSVRSGLGFAGMGSGVDWCIQGLDRNHAQSPNCRMAQP